MFKFVCSLVISFLLIGTSVFAEEKSAETDFSGEVVQIRVVSTLHEGMSKTNRAYYSPIDEFHYFAKALQKSLKNIEGNYHFVLIRFPEKLEDSDFSISIYLHDWRLSRGGFIENRFSASYLTDESKVDLGFFYGDSNQNLSPIRHLQEKAYAAAVIEAGNKLVRKLQPVLDQVFEEKGISDES